MNAITKALLANHEYVAALRNTKKKTMFRHIIASMKDCYVNTQFIPEENSPACGQHWYSIIHKGNTCLHEACIINDTESVSMLLGKGARLDITNESGHSPLCVALTFQSSEVVRQLIEEGADVDISRPEVGASGVEVSPLSCTLNESELKLLLVAGIDTCPRNDAYESDFINHVLVWRLPELLISFIEESGGGFGPISQVATQQTTLIHFAARLRDLALLTAMLCGTNRQPSINLFANAHLAARYKLIVNRKDMEGNTPLHSFFSPLFKEDKETDYAAVKLLLYLGADPTIANHDGATPLHLAAPRATSQVISLLTATSWSSVEDTKEHSNKGIPDSVTILHTFTGPKLAANVNALNNEGKPALIIAAERGNAEAVKRLLQVDCNPDLADPVTGRTALHYSMYLIFPSITQWLLASGANVNIKDANGRTPLHHLCAQSISDDSSGSKLIPLLLKSPGIDVNCVDNGGETPVSLASQSANRKKKLVELLRSLGGKVAGKRLRSGNQSENDREYQKRYSKK